MPHCTTDKALNAMLFAGLDDVQRPNVVHPVVQLVRIGGGRREGTGRGRRRDNQGTHQERPSGNRNAFHHSHR